MVTFMMAGRDPNYAKNLRERMLAATARNQLEANHRNLDIDWLFVEWNPPSDDLLSHDLAPLGFRCYVVSPEIHNLLVDSDVANKYSFMEGFAKNVGMRRAANEWLISTNADNILGSTVWDFVAAGEFERGVMYRAERKDVPYTVFSMPYSKIRRRVLRTYSLAGKLAHAAGDFMFLSSEDNPGYDEAMNDANPHSDGHFCWNWVKLGYMMESIGTVYKASHHLIMRNVRKKAVSHKGRKKSKISRITAYKNLDNWGLVDYPEVEIALNIWRIG